MIKIHVVEIIKYSLILPEEMAIFVEISKREFCLIMNSLPYFFNYFFFQFIFMIRRTAFPAKLIKRIYKLLIFLPYPGILPF